MSPLAERLAPVTGRLARLRRSMRRLFAFDGLSRLALALGAFVAVTFAADWTFHLPAPVRVGLSVAGLGLAAVLLARRVAYPLFVRISDDDLALFVEREYPELNDRLISAVQLAREPLDPDGGRTSPELVQALVAEAEEVSRGIDFGRVLVRRHVWRVAAPAAAVTAVLAGLAFWNPQGLASTYARRMAGLDVKWPRRTQLRVLDFADRRRVWPRGEDLPVAVAYSGVRPKKVTLRYRFRTGETGQERMVPLAGDRFQFLFTRVPGPFEFVVEGGDDVTEPHVVETVTPPSIAALRLYHEHPPYTRRPDTPADRPETSGNVVAPIGTRVRFEAEADEDLRSARLSVGPRGKETVTELPVGPDAAGRPRAFSGSFVVSEPAGEYALHLEARNGLSNRDPIRYTIRGVEDRPPEIVVREPVGDEFVTEVCERPLEIEVRDDYGVARIVLRTAVAAQGRARDESVTVFTREQNSRDYGEPLIRSQAVLDVGRLKLQTGDHVEIQFQAEDTREPAPPNARQSRVYRLSVVSMATLEKELQDAIEKIKALLKTQKVRQEAAWNRTGRLLSTHGRADVLAPDAQGEIRQAALEQNDVTSRLDGARRDIRYVLRRGVYNKIYDANAARKLQSAAEELDALVGDLADPSRGGLSRVVTARLDQASKHRSGRERGEALREAMDLQSRVASGIQRAIDFLDNWSSYQEVIRIARELKESQDRANREIRRIGTGK